MTTQLHSDSRRVVAEGAGTALLLVAVVGSGIMAERLAAGTVALALLANAIATGGALVALILAFGPISGLNPAVSAVTLARAATDTFAGIRPGDVPGFVVGQLIGATAATLLFRWLSPRAVAAVAPDVVVPHSVQEPSP